MRVMRASPSRLALGSRKLLVMQDEPKRVDRLKASSSCTPTIFKIPKLTLIYYLKRGSGFSLLLFIFFIHLKCWCMQGLCSCAEQGREVGSGLSNVLRIDEFGIE